MKYSKILILRLSAAGDIVLTFPAFFWLAENCAGAKIDWAVDERFAGLLDLLAGLNRAVVFPSKALRGKSSSLAAKSSAVWRFVREVRRERYDLVIDFQGLFKSGAVSFLSGASVRAAFAPGGHDSREMNHWLNNKIVAIPAGSGGDALSSKIIYRSIYLAARAIDRDPPAGYSMGRLVEPGPGRAGLGAFFDEIRRGGRAGRIIALNPFTNWPTKTWPAVKWAALIASARKRPGFADAAFIVLWGPSEKETAEKIAAADELAFVSPPTTLREVFCVLDRCDAAVSGDSFALHAAFVLGKPVVALFGASDPARCAPFGPNAATVTPGLSCQHCFKKTCARGTEECIKMIEPAAVLDALASVIR